MISVRQKQKINFGSTNPQKLADELIRFGWLIRPLETNASKRDEQSHLHFDSGWECPDLLRSCIVNFYIIIISLQV